jgi:hypothetical protein
MDDSNVIESYLKKPYWIIDILPKQVPVNARGQYFKIEHFLLNSQMDDIYRRFTNVLLKINCYEELSVCHALEGQWVANPSPETLQKWMMERKALYVMLDSSQAMIAISGDEHYMTLYCDDESPVSFIRTLVVSEGLFLWQRK